MSAEYQEYLKSDHWKALKEKVRHRCAICKAKANLDVHHLFYRNLYDCKVTDLRRLCRECHRVAHLLIKEGKIKPNKPWSHQSVFSATKAAVKRYRFGSSNAVIRD